MITIYWPRRWKSLHHMESWMEERGLVIRFVSRQRRAKRFAFAVFESQPMLPFI